MGCSIAILIAAGGDHFISHSRFVGNTGSIKFISTSSSSLTLNDCYFGDDTGLAVDIDSVRVTMNSTIFTNNSKGALRLMKSPLFGSNLTFSNNGDQTGTNTGGINFSAGDMTIHNSFFLGNKVNDVGAAISVWQSSTVVLQNVYFSTNTALNSAGCIFVHKSTLITTKCTFVSSWANNGGALSFLDSTWSSFFDSISYCTSVHIGGGAEVRNSIINLTSSSFTFNGGQLDGGAIYSGNGTTLTTINCQFSNNNASSRDGGAIYFYGTLWNDNNSTFFNNSGFTTGALSFSSSSATIQNTQILSNFARASDGMGGGMKAYDTTIIGKDVVCDGNRGNFQGGCISASNCNFNFSSSSSPISSFSNNTSSSGGGISFYSGILELNGIIIWHNTGGGLVVGGLGLNAVIAASDFRSNIADQGGAISASDSGSSM